MSRQSTSLGSHTRELISIHASLLEATGATSRFVEPVGGERVHLIEYGEGDPLIMLHGSGPTALQLLPLITKLPNLRVMAVDRPGFGLSDPHPWSNDRTVAAVVWIDGLLDVLSLESASFLGSSAGATWAIWYALARPPRVDNLILLGGPPTLSVNSPPPPLRMAATINMDDPPPTPGATRESVMQSMGGMGEGETIARYPEQIDAMVASGSDPMNTRASLDELQSLISADGWQPAVETSIDELRDLQPSTLLIWGERDPLGGPDAAKGTADAIPRSQLALLDAGHAPWLGHPREVAELTSRFLKGG